MSANNQVHRICVTPTRNESWIMRPFLAAATHWAEQVIVADQGSTDDTREIAAATPGVELVSNDDPTFDEVHRQQILIDRARQIPGRRIIFALDADEALSANALTSREWKEIEAAPPGTMIRLRWVNILPGFTHAWVPPEPRPFGLVDDGAQHSGRRIHNQRLPWRADAPTLDLEELVVVHFQYVLWDRMASKQRWYQAWEQATHRRKTPLQIFREYNHMRGWSEAEVQEVRPEWLNGFEDIGANFRELKGEPVTWWDREVFTMLRQHGTEPFRKIAIWEKNWNDFGRQIGVTDVDLSDPRSAFERTAHRLLAVTQKRRSNLVVRAFERMLRSTGW